MVAGGTTRLTITRFTLSIFLSPRLSLALAFPLTVNINLCHAGFSIFGVSE
jgi:hypothetical protein